VGTTWPRFVASNGWIARRTACRRTARQGVGANRRSIGLVAVLVIQRSWVVPRVTRRKPPRFCSRQAIASWGAARS
jgi:hypothetical protein